MLTEQDAFTVNINGPSLPGKNVEGIISYVPGWISVNSKITYPDLKQRLCLVNKKNYSYQFDIWMYL